MQDVVSYGMVIQYRLNELLTLRKMSARELARRSGVSTSTIHVLRHNEAERIDRSTLERLCKALQCTPGDLIVYIPDKVLPDLPSVAEDSTPYDPHA
jgi:putative transcriptional regulator